MRVTHLYHFLGNSLFFGRSVGIFFFFIHTYVEREDECVRSDVRVRRNVGLFSIDFANMEDTNNVMDTISNDQHKWERKGLDTGKVMQKKGKFFWDFQGTETEWKEGIIPYLASVLSDYMTDHQELKWIKNYIEDTFYYKDESEAITDIAQTLLEGEKKGVLRTPLFDKRKHFVYNELKKEIEEKKHIQWQPLLTFRLGTYHQLLMEAASKAIDEYKWEQEYQTMVESCRHHLKHAEEQMNILHLLLKEKPLFVDEHGHPIDEWTRLHQLEHSLVFEKELPFEYMVISPTVSLSPRRLYVYSDEENGTVQTLEMIFQEKMTLHPVKEWPLYEK